MTHSSTFAALQVAIAAHQAGRLAQAETAYRQILDKHPKQADALHFLGMLHFQQGRTEQGLHLVQESLVQAPDNPHAWNNLGNMLVMMEREEQALQAYRCVTRLAPEMAETWYNLGVCLRNAGEMEEAIRHLREAIARNERFFRAYETLAMLCYRMGLNADAAEVYAQWSRLDPANAKARHMAAATSGQNVPARASDAYVQTLFDKFAAAFDHNLKHLGYRAPEIVAAALRDHASAAGAEAMDLLDAGCGTGLCGPLVRPLCRTLVGVDLSPKMIDRAQERGCYDELAVAEMTAFLLSRPAAFDAIISADTLVYFGALDAVFAAAKNALRSGGVLIATVEALPNQDGFGLETHGRYSHSEPYVRAQLTQAGFTAIEVLPEVLRQERLQDVKGYLIRARHPSLPRSC